MYGTKCFIGVFLMVVLLLSLVSVTEGSSGGCDRAGGCWGSGSSFSSMNLIDGGDAGTGPKIKHLNCSERGEISFRSSAGKNWVISAETPNGGNISNVPYKTDLRSSDGRGTYDIYTTNLSFHKKGIYFLTIISADDGVIYFEDEAMCPGGKILCALNSLALTHCYSEGNNFYIYLNWQSISKGGKNTTKPDFIKDIEYTLYAHKQYHERITENYRKTQGLPRNTELIQLTNETYLIKSHLPDQNFVERIMVQLKNCDQYSSELKDYMYPQTRDSLKCEGMPPCTSNSDCKETEMCNVQYKYCTKEDLKPVETEEVWVEKATSILTEKEIEEYKKKGNWLIISLGLLILSLFGIFIWTRKTFKRIDNLIDRGGKKKT